MCQKHVLLLVCSSVVCVVGGVSQYVALHDGLDDCLQHPSGCQLAAGGGYWQEVHRVQNSGGHGQASSLLAAA